MIEVGWKSFLDETGIEGVDITLSDRYFTKTYQLLILPGVSTNPGARHGLNIYLESIPDMVIMSDVHSDGTDIRGGFGGKQATVVLQDPVFGVKKYFNW